MSVAQAFLSQARACENLGSPFMARLMSLCAERLGSDTATGAFIHDWAGDPHHSADSVPLRLAGGLHRIVLTRADARLAAVYPPNSVEDDDIWAEVHRALADHAPELIGALASAPQTNEIRRSVGLIPALHLIAHECALPLRLSELGASAGLNLINDRFCLLAGGERFGPADSPVQLEPDWKGPIPARSVVNVADRAGCDLSPIDLADPQQRVRLLSYLWPDQAGRARNTSAAISLALQYPPRVDRADAIDWLEHRLKTAPEGVAHVVFHTIAWQYFPRSSQDQGEALLEAAGKLATSERPLYRLGMEADDVDDGACLSLRRWPGGETRELARICFHGRWIRWTA